MGGPSSETTAHSSVEARMTNQVSVDLGGSLPSRPSSEYSVVLQKDREFSEVASKNVDKIQGGRVTLAGIEDSVAKDEVYYAKEILKLQDELFRSQAEASRLTSLNMALDGQFDTLRKQSQAEIYNWTQEYNQTEQEILGLTAKLDYSRQEIVGKSDEVCVLREEGAALQANLREEKKLTAMQSGKFHIHSSFSGKSEGEECENHGSVSGLLAIQQAKRIEYYKEKIEVLESELDVAIQSSRGAVYALDACRACQFSLHEGNSLIHAVGANLNNNIDIQEPDLESFRKDIDKIVSSIEKLYKDKIEIIVGLQMSYDECNENAIKNFQSDIVKITEQIEEVRLQVKVLNEQIRVRENETKVHNEEINEQSEEIERIQARHHDSIERLQRDHKKEVNKEDCKITKLQKENNMLKLEWKCLELQVREWQSSHTNIQIDFDAYCAHLTTLAEFNKTKIQILQSQVNSHKLLDKARECGQGAHEKYLHYARLFKKLPATPISSLHEIHVTGGAKLTETVTQSRLVMDKVDTVLGGVQPTATVTTTKRKYDDVS